MTSWGKVNCIAALNGLKAIDSESVDCVIADPPYNLGYDFGNNSRKQNIKEYTNWCQEWALECDRILKPSGTMFVYGFSEILAHVSVSMEMEHRWLVWHYTNKTKPQLNFWQRTHESILCAWKDKSQRIFNRDDVREPYTEGFVKRGSGKNRTRPSTSGRFGTKGTTTYKVNDKGALPRDVIKVSSLAGGLGARERISYCTRTNTAIVGSKEMKQHIGSNKDYEKYIVKHPTQKPTELTKRLLLSCMPESGSVVIPFAGTGSECLVAKNLGHKFIGFDLNEDYVKMANSILQRKTEGQ
jgi:site-specific DNA-methyltransferase (adenine-specific)|tara:strand:+ start:286 stop:1179 length:894 start_codon:yes stop_codon:yes gene_type:complete